MKRQEVGLLRKTTKNIRIIGVPQHSNQAPHGSVSYNHWQLFVKPHMHIMPVDNLHLDTF
jgi:hypothetical protein